MNTDLRTDIAELELPALEDALDALGRPRFHARQIFQWIHKRGVIDFDAMSDLGRELRAQLGGAFTIGDAGGRPAGTIGRRHHQVPAAARATASGSSRSSSRTLRPTGHATPGHVLPLDPGRLRDALRVLPDRQDGDRPQPHRRRNRRAGARARARAATSLASRFNIVLMGMGEPLHNYDETMKALRILADEHGLAVSPRRITLSTVGVLPALERLATEPLMPNLAISLHATTEDQRDLLVPINRKYGLKELLDACRRFPLKRRERITFEYVLLNDVNDTPGGRAAARQAARTASRRRSTCCRSTRRPGIPFERPSDDRVNRFARILADHGVTRVGAQVARPRHPRRVRPADHRLRPRQGAWTTAGVDVGFLVSPTLVAISSFPWPRVLLLLLHRKTPLQIFEPLIEVDPARLVRRERLRQAVVLRLEVPLSRLHVLDRPLHLFEALLDRAALVRRRPVHSVGHLLDLAHCVLAIPLDLEKSRASLLNLVAERGQSRLLHLQPPEEQLRTRPRNRRSLDCEAQGANLLQELSHRRRVALIALDPLRLRCGRYSWRRAAWQP